MLLDASAAVLLLAVEVRFLARFDLDVCVCVAVVAVSLLVVADDVVVVVVVVVLLNKYLMYVE